MKNGHFIPLVRNRVIVTGARHALLVDFGAGTLRQLDESVTRNIKRAADAPSVSERRHRLERAVASTGPRLTTGGGSNPDHGACLGEVPADAPPVDSGRTTADLEFLWIEVTARCNLRCIHCYAGSQSGQDPGLPTGTIRKTIDQAAELGCRAIQFTGGECLLRKDLPLLLDHALNRGVSLIEVFTNGTLLTESLVKFFSRKGIQVALSLYSHRAEVHDRITRVPGSFERTLSALKLLLAHEVVTRCATVAMKPNEPDLGRTTYFLSQLGVACQWPDPVRPSGRGVELALWPDAYGRRCYQTQPNFQVSLTDFHRNCRRNSCWCGKAALTSNGDVVPCVFARDQVAGHVPEQTLAEIVRGEKMRRYWSLTHDAVETCKLCEYRYLCPDCRALVLGLTGNLHAKSPWCTYDPRSGTWGAAPSPTRSSLEPCAGGASCGARKRAAN